MGIIQKTAFYYLEDKLRVAIKECNEPPGIFWKYFDLFRRGKIDIEEFSVKSMLPVDMLRYYLCGLKEEAAYET